MTERQKKTSATPAGATPVNRRPDPGPKTRAAIEAAAKSQETRLARTAMRYRVAEDGKPVAIEGSHADQNGWWAQLNETFGTGSREFAMLALADLGNCLVSPEASIPSEMRSNFALAAVGGIAPKDEFEALMASQLVGTHALAMDCIHRAMSAETMERRESLVTQAAKMSRTFASLTEAMAKHRTGGKQQVEVRYVYVDARGAQNVIQTGGGAGEENPRQPHRPHSENRGEQQPSAIPYDAAPIFAPVFGSQPRWEPLPVASDEGQGEMPDTRWVEPRSTHGTEERLVSSRAENQGTQSAHESRRRRATLGERAAR